MRPLATLIPLISLAVLPAAARADAGGTIFTIAGARASHVIYDGERATSADFDAYAPVTVLPDGDVLVGSDEMVWRIHDGVVRRVAGTGDVGHDGDGGPARKADMWVDDLAALPDGGFLVADGEDGLIRMIDPQGIVTTVAGGGLLRGDGVPARQADLGLSFQVAVDPAGGFLVSDDDTRIRRVTPDGRVFAVAGTGRSPDRPTDLHGQPATSAPLSAADFTATADGSLLIADEAGRVDRVAPDGSITAAVAQGVAPTAIAATSDGGFALLDEPFGPTARIWRFAPDGTRTPLAGTGPLELTAPAGLPQRLDGGPATRAVLDDPHEIALAPDGGVVLTDTIQDRDSYGTLVRYVAPAAPGRLAVALQRDRGRVIGSDTSVGVTLSRPATVALSVAGLTKLLALPAGAIRMTLPPGLPSTRPLTVHVAAFGAGGERAFDRVRIYPRRWLPTETGALVTHGLTRRGFFDVCRRFGPRRVDCRLDVHSKKRCAITSVRLAAAGLRWGRYGCRFASRPRFRRRPHRLTRREWTCVPDERMCPPAIFGRVSEGELLPSD